MTILSIEANKILKFIFLVPYKKFIFLVLKSIYVDFLLIYQYIPIDYKE